MRHRRALALIIGLGILPGCAQLMSQTNGLSRSDDLGLVNPSTEPPVDITDPTNDPADMKRKRNEILSKWVMKSDYLCSNYQTRIARSVRDSRLGTDLAATLLSGLATIFAKAAMIHPLSGAATIAMGIGGDIQTDLFLQQAGDVITNAIQTTRNQARKELQGYWSAEYNDYPLSQALLDVERYDRETCSIERAINDIRSSLGIAAPVALTANNPIIGPSSAPMPNSGASVTGAPVTTVTTSPATSTVTAGGAVVTTSPTVSVTTTAAPALVAPPPPPPPPPTRRAIQPAAGCTPPESSEVANRKTALKTYINSLAQAAAADPTKKPALDAAFANLGVPNAPSPTPVLEGFTIIHFVQSKVCNAAQMDDAANKVPGFKG